MGTRYSAVFHAAESMQTDRLAAALFAAVDRVDRQMSNWKPDSDLHRLSAAPVGEWVTLPRELMRVLACALKVGRDSRGAFDIGVAEMVAAWGFGPPGPHPDPGRIARVSSEARAGTREVLQLDDAAGRARKSAPLSLDLGGIAKGFGVDEMARVMEGFGLRSWLVGIDGEMRAKGLKPDGTAWAVAHERPVRGHREAMGVIELADMAVATSGNYRHWREVDGRLLSHSMDPATGRPVENTIASVSVLAETCMAADAWATALLVLGADAGLRLAETMGLPTIIVLGDGTVRSTV